MNIQVTKTYIFELTEQDKQRANKDPKWLVGLLNSADMENNTPTQTTRKPKRRTPKAAKRTAPKAKRYTGIMFNCPVGGERIKRQGWWNHTQKHAKAKGWTQDQINALREGTKR